jgi:hypothetical protein
MSKESCGQAGDHSDTSRLLFLFELRLEPDIRPQNSFRFLVIVGFGSIFSISCSWRVGA